MKLASILIQYILYHIGFYTSIEYSNRYSPYYNKKRIIALNYRNVKNNNIGKMSISTTIVIIIANIVYFAELQLIGYIILVILPFMLMVYIVNMGRKMTSIYYYENMYYLEKLSYGNFKIEKFEKDNFNIYFDTRTNELQISYNDTILVNKTVKEGEEGRILENDHITY